MCSLNNIVYLIRNKNIILESISVELTSNDVKLFLTDDASLATRCPALLI
jgi:hypothetical protein